MTRPPVPLRPWWLWLEDRQHEIQLALDRNAEAGLPPCPSALLQRALLGVLLLAHPRNPNPWR